MRGNVVKRGKNFMKRIMVIGCVSYKNFREVKNKAPVCLQ